MDSTPSQLERERPEAKVSTLSPELQALVKVIQINQAKLKASLRSHHSWSTLDGTSDGPAVPNASNMPTATSLKMDANESVLTPLRSPTNKAVTAATATVAAASATVADTSHSGDSGYTNSDSRLIAPKPGKRDKQMQRLQDKRYMFSAATGASQHAPSEVEYNEDWDMQEAIRLSLMVDTLQTKLPPPPPPAAASSRSDHGEQWQTKKTKAAKGGDASRGLARNSRQGDGVASASSIPAEESKRTVDNNSADEVISNCLLCDEAFDCDGVLCCIGSCNHACICGVSRFAFSPCNC
jgi:hypothetical protein